MEQKEKSKKPKSKSIKSPPKTEEVVSTVSPQLPIDKLVSVLPLDSITRLATLFHELSGTSESKTEIVAILARGERTVGEISSVVNLSGSAVSQHLNRLKAYRLVDCQRRNHNQVYSLRSNLGEELTSLIREVFNLPVNK